MLLHINYAIWIKYTYRICYIFLWFKTYQYFHINLENPYHEYNIWLLFLWYYTISPLYPVPTRCGQKFAVCAHASTTRSLRRAMIIQISALTTPAARRMSSRTTYQQHVLLNTYTIEPIIIQHAARIKPAQNNKPAMITSQWKCPPDWWLWILPAAEH